MLLAGLFAGAALPMPLLAQDVTPVTPPPGEVADPAVQAQPPAVDPGQASAEPEQAAAETGGDPTDPDFEEPLEEEEIVVTGQRERGAVAGDIPPETQLDRREIRALGASSIAEVLEALAPQTQSARGREGGRPVTLINGRRISGFSELRDIPPEAIERIDILPEEVALRYGYRADQKVVNFVLRRRFRAITAEANAGVATAGGRESYGGDINLLRIQRDTRFNIDAQFQHQAPLFESERNIVQQDAGVGGPSGNTFDLGNFRTLLSESDRVGLNATYNQNVFGNVSATVNGTFDANSSRGFLGLPTAGGSEALTRETDTLAGHLGIALNGDIAPWRWSATANYDRSSSDSVTETGAARANRTQSITQSGSVEGVASGPLFTLPAGEINTTVRAGFDARGLESEAFRNGLNTNRNLSRERGNAQVSVDIPIASRRRAFLSALGNLSANFNAEVEHLSDFGTLRTLGGGLNWSPIAEVSLIASVTDEDGAPSMQQLGDPITETPNVRVFDFTRGTTANVLVVEGGNPDLIADNRRVFKLGATIRPFSETDLSIVANYTQSRTRNLISSFPIATAEIEAAFPERFTRDASGNLTRLDTRPINFERAESKQLRWGINFSKSVGPQPPAGGGGWRQRMRQQGGAPGAPGAAPGQPGAAPQAGQTAQGGAPATPADGAAPAQGGGRGAGAQGGGRQGGGGFAGRGGGGGGRGFGGGRGGRLQLALYHTWRFEDSVLIREGVPELDFLGGSAVGNRGGRPRHEVEAQAGFTKNGLGFRATGTWQAGTTVNGGPDRTGSTNGDLRFSDTLALNLRLFADLGAQPFAREHRWLRGTRISLNIDNVLNSRPTVRDQNGVVPFSYQGAFLDPLGRSVRLSIRKLFF